MPTPMSAITPAMKSPQPIAFAQPTGLVISRQRIGPPITHEATKATGSPIIADHAKAKNNKGGVTLAPGSVAESKSIGTTAAAQPNKAERLTALRNCFAV